jgi:hypothetical protein
VPGDNAAIDDPLAASRTKRMLMNRLAALLAATTLGAFVVAGTGVGTAAAATTALIIWDCSGGTNQKWILP